MEPPVQREWPLVDTLGPLFPHFGLRNRDLCLARDAGWHRVGRGELSSRGRGAPGPQTHPHEEQDRP